MSMDWHVWSTEGLAYHLKELYLKFLSSFRNDVKVGRMQKSGKNVLFVGITIGKGQVAQESYKEELFEGFVN